ncbi:hypothetical protein SNL152K_4737 [Streptomyces sp. NL15-2K]|nr:hypothetical protein SNL152K_4737 [Streptomyces sp. NL15-2K]
MPETSGDPGGLGRPERDPGPVAGSDRARRPGPYGRWGGVRRGHGCTSLWGVYPICEL